MQQKKVLKTIFESINSVFVGKEESSKVAILSLITGLHSLIEDKPGVGKTTLVKSLAKAAGLDFGRIQFTPDLLPGDILGMKIFDQQSGEFSYQKGAIMHQLVLADEINRASPRTQAGLLEAMQEESISLDGQNYSLPKPFLLMATQNPVTFSGTFELPEAQLDRFGLSFSLGYPLPEQESKILTRFQVEDPVQSLEKVCGPDDVQRLREEVRKVRVHHSLVDFMVKFAGMSRRDDNIKLPLSPRALQHWQLASQGEAFWQGRDYVIPEDIVAMTIPVFSHRLILSQRALIKKLTPISVLNELLEAIPLPTGLKV